MIRWIIVALTLLKVTSLTESLLSVEKEAKAGRVQKVLSQISIELFALAEPPVGRRMALQATRSWSCS